MKPPLRRAMFLATCVMLLLPILRIARAMPRFGRHPLPYGDAINAIGVATRHVTNMVSAINFDIRGFDTLGEEFMLLCAVTGTVLLLRGSRGENVGDKPAVREGRAMRSRSDGLVLACRIAGPLMLLFGLYVGLHAMTTPGGGFQGGAIIATGLLLTFLGENYATWRRVSASKLFNALEGCGASLYGLCGFASMIAGGTFLTNFLPYGKPKDLFSGGLMILENLGVMAAVAGGFVLVFGEFLEETRLGTDDDNPEDSHV